MRSTSRRTTRRLVAGIAAATMLIAGAGIAAADNLRSDLDAVFANDQTSINLGSVAGGSPQSVPVLLYLDKTGNNNATLPVSVSGSGNLGALMLAVEISAYGKDNGQTGAITFTAPAAQATAESYRVTVTFAATPDTNVNTTPAKVDIDFSVPASGVAPALAPVLSGTTGDNDWFVSGVSIDWNITGTPTPTVITGCATGPFTADGPYNESCSVTNSAGTANGSVQFKIDRTPPTSVVSGVTEGAVYPTAPTVTCLATDATSGVATHGEPSGNTTTPGAKTVTCNGATDNAGNTQTTASAEVNYTLAPIGGYNSNFDGDAVLRVKPNQAIPLKWAFNDGTTNYALLSGATLSSVSSNRCTMAEGTDGTEQATELAAGASGLQTLADDSYQMNWKATSTTGCRALTVNMALKSGGTLTRTILVNIVK